VDSSSWWRWHVGAPWGRELGFQVAAEGAWWQHSRVSGGRCYITSPTMAGAPRPQELWDGMREGGGRCRTRGAAERTRALFFFPLHHPCAAGLGKGARPCALWVWGRACAPVLRRAGRCGCKAAARRAGGGSGEGRGGIFFPFVPPCAANLRTFFVVVVVQGS
jgi:hypothetical protein